MAAAHLKSCELSVLASLKVIDNQFFKIIIRIVFFMEPYRSLHMYSDVLVVARSVPRTLLNLDPRDDDPPPSTLQPTQSFLETAGKSLTLYMIGSSRLHRKMVETSRVEIDELPASIPWIVFDKARTVVKLFHTRSIASQFQGGKALNSLGWLSLCLCFGVRAS